jgi:hypothetical protein
MAAKANSAPACPSQALLRSFEEALVQSRQKVKNLGDQVGSGAWIAFGEVPGCGRQILGGIV